MRVWSPREIASQPSFCASVGSAKDASNQDLVAEENRCSAIPAGYPARMTATTAFVSPDCLVLIEAVAYKPKV